MNSQFKYHYETKAILQASPQSAFDYLNDHRNLSAHMGKSSWMMAGSKMDVKLDEKQGQGVGAEIILYGKMMGIELFVREFVTVSESPKKKIWETSGPQKLLILDQYRMGFELIPAGENSELKVFIDYNLPHGAQKILGVLFSKFYARWCTEQMAKDAKMYFSKRLHFATGEKSLAARR
ncbi:MAG: hypothetical protein A4S09_15235 [Proteobacteria bacterium SG_bin7]|nr:MAG: hypothetical protein A4S09_15235 [Proteobacteria bacterium SG_bin7]